MYLFMIVAMLMDCSSLWQHEQWFLNKDFCKLESIILQYLGGTMVKNYDGVYSKGSLFTRSIALSEIHGYIYYAKATPIDYGIVVVNKNRIYTISIKNILVYAKYDDRGGNRFINVYDIVVIGNRTYLINEKDDIIVFLLEYLLSGTDIDNKYFSKANGRRIR